MVTDRPRKQLLLKTGFRLLNLFEISEPDEYGKFSVVENVSDLEFAPEWLTREVITEIVNEVDKDQKEL